MFPVFHILFSHRFGRTQMATSNSARPKTIRQTLRRQAKESLRLTCAHSVELMPNSDEALGLSG